MNIFISVYPKQLQGSKLIEYQRFKLTSFVGVFVGQAIRLYKSRHLQLTHIAINWVGVALATAEAFDMRFPNGGNMYHFRH